MAAVRHLGFVGRVLGAYWDHPRLLLDGLHRCAEFGLNRWNSFTSMKLSIFLHVWLVNAYSPPKLGVWGISPNGEFHSRKVADFVGDKQMGSNINETPKRHIIARFRVV